MKTSASPQLVTVESSSVPVLLSATHAQQSLLPSCDDQCKNAEVQVLPQPKQADFAEQEAVQKAQEDMIDVDKVFERFASPPDSECSVMTPKSYSRAVKERTLSTQHPEIFRAVSVGQLLAGASLMDQLELLPEDWLPPPHGAATGSPIAETPVTFARPSRLSSSTTSALAQKLLDGRDASDAEAEHVHSDRVFYNTLKVCEVDFFISHVWQAPRWQKVLAILYYVNCERACCFSFAAWAVGAAALFCQSGFAGHGGQTNKLVLYLLAFPLSVFFIAFFTAHSCRLGRAAPTAWFDKVCIHQSRKNLKKIGVAALPEFVANSKRMLILQSQTYFERLWCNMEVATFCALSGTDKIDFVPLWFPPWMLLTIVLNAACLLWGFQWQWLVPAWGDIVMEHCGPDSPLTLYMTLIFGCGAFTFISLAPVACLSYWAMRKRLKERLSVAKQMSEFRLEHAKCSEENDREIVELHVSRVFQEHPHLGLAAENADASDSEDGLDAQCPIARFNRYINSEFQEEVEAKLGSITSMPYKTALLTVLPMHFGWLVNVLSCDGMGCSLAAEAEGFPNTASYMLSNAFAWILCNVLVAPTLYPAALRILSCISALGTADRVSYKILKFVIGMLFTAGWYFLDGMLFGFLQAAMSQAVIEPQPMHALAAAVAVTLYIIPGVYLFELYPTDFVADILGSRRLRRRRSSLATTDFDPSGL